MMCCSCSSQARVAVKRRHGITEYTEHAQPAHTTPQAEACHYPSTPSRSSRSSTHHNAKPEPLLFKTRIPLITPQCHRTNKERKSRPGGIHPPSCIRRQSTALPWRPIPVGDSPRLRRRRRPPYRERVGASYPTSSPVSSSVERGAAERSLFFFFLGAPVP